MISICLKWCQICHFHSPTTWKWVQHKHSEQKRQTENNAFEVLDNCNLAKMHLQHYELYHLTSLIFMKIAILNMRSYTLKWLAKTLLYKAVPRTSTRNCIHMFIRPVSVPCKLTKYENCLINWPCCRLIHKFLFLITLCANVRWSWCFVIIEVVSGK